MQKTKKAATTRMMSKGERRRLLHENVAGYSFILPWLIGFFLLTLWPMIQSLYLSFTNYDLFTSPEWVGLENYINFLTKDRNFWTSLGRTFRYVVLVVPLRLGFSLFVAMLLNQKVKGMSFYRTAMYLPSLIGASVAVAVLWRNIFGLEGYINTLLGIFGIDRIPWLSHPNLSMTTLVFLGVWQFGSTMIIFLGGLKQIPSELYESASVDGAGPVRQFISITLPMLSPSIFFNLILGVISAFQQFSSAFLITKGGPAYSTYLYSLMLYERAFTHYKMGQASGLAWILLAIVGILTLINFFVSKYWVYYDDSK